jgi:hypothetical protein
MEGFGMTVERKSFRPLVKAADKGIATVVIATLNVVDSDGDVTLPGFFGEQTAQAIGAHNWGSVPIGKSRVFEQGNEALAELRFNLATMGGKDWYEAIKFDFDNQPTRQQYSYGFSIRPGGARSGEFEGHEVRFLGPLPDGTPGADVHEVSPVLLGAGVDTRTVGVKGRGLTFADEIKHAGETVEELRVRTAAFAELRAKEGRSLSQERRTEIAGLAAGLAELARLGTGLEALIKAEHEAPNKTDALRLLAEFEHVQFELGRIGAGV